MKMIHLNEMEGTLSQKVDDINLFRQVSDSAKMLQPVAITLDNGSTIADVCAE